ncbi:MAG: biotin/lipoyl-containing protein, partial [Nocardioides sp.]
MARLAIRMPKMSMTMTEGEVATWHASVGDEVAIGDVVCEVMTDKVDMEVESTVAGTLVEIAV